ncbi:claudin domain containing protein-like protein [Dinothrombium tinctorium]|uniref:Claudin domain containing protein-like protein n=1 Tax=Dinothrombium tinctorium TaxID=1965070 RepID=A0A443RAZ0_9ACAR|nr:claudin domain containing protein-like protein [Dinothrombium tinctorium]
MARKSDARIAAIAVTGFAFIVTVIAFFTPYWLASERRFYGSEFDKLGLWETCFRSIHSKDDLEMRKFYSGCRWIFAEEYRNLNDLLFPAFFVITQVFYTLGFIALLISVIILLSVQLCAILENQIKAFKYLALVMFFCALFSTIAVVVFGIRGDDEGWMPEPEHNFLSWSFALAVVGTFFEWVAFILYWIENRILVKKDLKRQHQMYGMEPLAVKVCA